MRIPSQADFNLDSSVIRWRTPGLVVPAGPVESVRAAGGRQRVDDLRPHRSERALGDLRADLARIRAGRSQTSKG